MTAAQVMERDEMRDMASYRQLVLLRWTAVGRVTAEYGHLEALGATVRAIAARLRTLWPPGAAELQRRAWMQSGAIRTANSAAP